MIAAVASRAVRGALAVVRWLSTARGLACVAAIVLLAASACERKRRLESKLTTASAAGSGQVLDGMQLESAHRVATETAKEAMRAGNAQRLKQLREWVEGRASVPIFSAHDLAALDAAIACLERPTPPADVAEQLARAKGSKLADAAGRACDR